MEGNNIALFEEKHIRHIDIEGKRWFAIADVIEILTDSPNPSGYWRVLKKRLKDEGANETVTNCNAFKMKAKDGRMRDTDCADTEGVLRIIISVPSPKAEPFRQWLVGLGKREIEETENPELGIDRLKELYKAKGYPDEWIERRIQTIEIRKQLTNEWQERGVKEGQEYAILTAEIAKATFGLTPTEHSKVKGLEKENLRDHMTPLELIFTALGEEATRLNAVKDDAQGYEENHEAAQKGGRAAGGARESFEKLQHTKVVSSESYLKQLKNNEDDKKSIDEPK